MKGDRDGPIAYSGVTRFYLVGFGHASTMSRSYFDEMYIRQHIRSLAGDWFRLRSAR